MVMHETHVARGRDIINGEWIVGYYGKHIIGGENGSRLVDVIFTLYTDKKILWREIDPATIGRCTGVRDENRKLIFEGDIVSCVSDGFEPEIYRVMFFGLRWRLESLIYAFSPDLIDFINDYTTIEIIGNIWDNPELYEVVKDA